MSPISMSLYCGNNAAISIVYNLVQYDRTKYIEVDRHFIGENQGRSALYNICNSRDQVTDILTKAVSKVHLSEMLGKLGILDIYSPT